MKLGSVLAIYALVIAIGAVVGWLILQSPAGVAIGAAIGGGVGAGIVGVERQKRAGRL